jgi:hypothetical protein
MDALILISPQRDIEFQVHINTLNLVVKATFAHNLIGKCNQLIAYTSRLVNKIERNYTMTKREAFAMVYAIHKFCHDLLGNKLFCYVDHMALLYLVWKSHVSRRIKRWLLLFLEYDFLIIYKPSHYVVDALSWMFDLIKECGIPNQTMETTLFLLQLVWLQEIFE